MTHDSSVKNRIIRPDLLIAMLLLLALAFIGCPPSTLVLEQEAEDPQAVALKKLREDSKQPLKIRFESGVPRFVSVEVPLPTGASDNPVELALDYLKRNKELYLIEDPYNQLFLENIVTNESEHHIFFGQRRDGTPVFGAQLAVHLNKEAVTSTNGNWLADLPVFPPPAVDENSAEAIALKDLGGDAQRIGHLKLVFFNRKLFMSPAEITNSETDDKTHQAWRLTVQGGETAESLIYFVDAQNGEILFRLNLKQSHAPQQDVWIRTAGGSGEFLCTCTNFCTEWFDENGLLSGANPDAEGNNTFNFSNQIYAYFYNNFHRHSWDGHDRITPVILDMTFTPPQNNAYFNTICGNFIFGNNMATLDIFAHEFTHGVTQTSAGGGLIYSNQPGALNESYSDVFAAMIDDANWTIGEGSAAGTVRDMGNPRPGHPDHMRGLVTTTSDFGGVHTNCCIPNRVAFLIAAGGTHNEITVSGIGRPKTAQLYYEVLSRQLTFSADFEEARRKTVEVAQDAARTGRWGFTAADVCSVVNAFASVGLGEADIDCDGLDDNADSDDDGDTFGDNTDNCPRIPNPNQANADGDSMGNACDPDDDNDRIVDARDNCPLTSNPNQADMDRDLRGDVCDDSDGDGVFDATDNCPFNSNSNQSNLDGDHLGDACDTDADGDGIANDSDNCRGVWNRNQTDSDRDGDGDACDSCPAAANTGDTDSDGTDDVCDADDDNDGVLDIADNCPTMPNPDQRDLNGDKIGDACDPNGGLIYVGPASGSLFGRLQFREKFLYPYQIVVLPDPTTFDWNPSGIIEIHVQLEMDMTTRVVDDQGFVVAPEQFGSDNVFRFGPKPDFFYRPPGGGRFGVRTAMPEGESKPYSGRQYILEIFPSKEVNPDRTYKMQAEVIYYKK